MGEFARLVVFYVYSCQVALSAIRGRIFGLPTRVYDTPFDYTGEYWHHHGSVLRA